MTPFDIFVLVVVVISALIGLSRGLVAEAFGLGAWVMAFLALFFLFQPVSGWLRSSMGSPVIADLAALIMVVVVTMVLVRIAGNMLSGRIKESVLGSADRFFGALFGLVRGMVLIAVVFLGLSFFIPGPSMPDWVTGARTYPLVRTAADTLSTVLGRARAKDDGAQDADGDGFPDIESPGFESEPLPDDGGYTDEQNKALEELLEQNRHSEIQI